LQTIPTPPGGQPYSPSIRESLRTATFDLHAEVDAGFSGPFDKDTFSYIKFLLALTRVIVPLERALESAGVERLLIDWAERRRTAALILDLQDLGQTVTAEASVPPMGGEAWQFGALYVLEGSRLGGALLLRRARKNSDVRVQQATRYLDHGSGRHFWQSFLARLEDSAAVARAHEEAVAGARAIFSLFLPKIVERGARV